MRIHYLQHVPFEGLGSIKAWVHEKGFNLTSTRLFDDETLPDIEDIDWLIIMGGPMFVYEEDKYPWLVREKAFIQKAITGGKRVLGICLGAQLIADVLGASVCRCTKKEVGWFPISLTTAGCQHPLFKAVPKELMCFHWHSDTFAIPEGAQHIALNANTQNQAFTYGDAVLALQFHLETTPHIVNSLIKRFADELIASPQVQTAQQMLAEQTNFVNSAGIMYQLLDNLLMVEGGQKTASW